MENKANLRQNNDARIGAAAVGKKVRTSQDEGMLNSEKIKPAVIKLRLSEWISWSSQSSQSVENSVAEIRN